MARFERDMDRELAYEFTLAFMTVPGEPVVLSCSGSTWPGIRRSVILPVGSEQRCVKDVVFPELTMPSVSTVDLATRLAEVSALAAEWNVDTVSLHGLPIDVRGQLNVSEGWIARSLMGFWTEVGKWSPSPKARRALRRAAARGVYCTIATTRQEFQLLRKTLDFLDFGPRDSPEHVDRQVSFFEIAYRRGRGVGLLAQRERQTLAGMFSVVIRRRLYMLIHGYDPAAVSFYPNDLLYANTIDAAKEVGAEMVCWGDVDPNDVGLARMKGKYSTRVMDNPSIHWLGNL